MASRKRQPISLKKHKFLLNNKKTMAIDYVDFYNDNPEYSKKLHKLCELVGNGLMDFDKIACNDEFSEWALSKVDKLIAEANTKMYRKITPSQAHQKRNYLKRRGMFRVDDYSLKEPVIDLPRIITCYLAMPAMYKRMCQFDVKKDSQKYIQDKIKMKELAKTLQEETGASPNFIYYYLSCLEVLRHKSHKERRLLKELGESDVILKNNFKHRKTANFLRKRFNENLFSLGYNYEKDISIPDGKDIFHMTNYRADGSKIMPRTKQLGVHNIPDKLVKELAFCDKQFISCETLPMTNVKSSWYVGIVRGKRYLFECTEEATTVGYNKKNLSYDQISMSLYVLIKGEMEGACLLVRDDHFFNNNRKHTNVTIQKKGRDLEVIREKVQGAHEHIYKSDSAVISPANPTSPNAMEITNLIARNGLDKEEIEYDFSSAFSLELPKRLQKYEEEKGFKR